MKPGETRFDSSVGQDPTLQVELAAGWGLSHLSVDVQGKLDQW